MTFEDMHVCSTLDKRADNFQYTLYTLNAIASRLLQDSLSQVRKLYIHIQDDNLNGRLLATCKTLSAANQVFLQLLLYLNMMTTLSYKT